MKRCMFIMLTILFMFCTFHLFSDITVQYRCAETTVSTNAIRPIFNIINTGPESYSLTDLVIHYYYTNEDLVSQAFFSDFAVIGSTIITGTFRDEFIEIGFTSEAGTLNPGNETGEIQVRMNKTDWSSYNQSDDWSFDSTKTTLEEWENVTLYSGTTLLWGIEGPGETFTPESTPTTTPTVVPEGYVINVDVFGKPNTLVRYSGDYSGIEEPPFTIGPFVEPYTVYFEPTEIDIPKTAETPIPTPDFPTATPSATPYEPETTPPGAVGSVWFVPDDIIVLKDHTFITEIHLNSGSQIFAAYAFHITFNQEIINIDNDSGLRGVTEGSDGFIAAVSLPFPGEIIISGFDASGEGPGEDLYALDIHWIAREEGTTTLALTVETLADLYSGVIGFPRGIDGFVTVMPSGLLGDVNEDGVVDIVDALLTARYYVELPVEPFNEAYADVNSDGAIDIVDALLIAHYYVGLISSFEKHFGGTGSLI